jgi:hypothetical protein
MSYARLRWASLVVLAMSPLAAGLSNIDPIDKFVWAENIGWLNFHDANGTADGVRVHKTFLSGYVWAENVGWINLGGGSPAGGVAYANDPGDSATFGVNIDPPTGDLFGMAWGENIGWVNFDTRTALSPHNQQARFEFAAGRFRGYAWGENVGWINLDDTTHFVAYVPPNCSDPFADVDGDADADQDDFGPMQRCLSSAGVPADFGCECFDRPEAGFPQGDNDVDADDVNAFENCASGPTVPVNPACGD